MPTLGNNNSSMPSALSLVKLNPDPCGALTITKNEIDEIINKFEIALEQTMKKII